MNHLNGLIAVELGWRDIRPAMCNIGRGDSTGIPPGELRTYVPNWAGDLNLMHELERDLTIDEIKQYVRLLNHSVLATAEQKAIAWLKVKGVQP